MKKIFLMIVALMATTISAKADGDWFWNDGVAQYNIYNDHRRVVQRKTTVIKKIYNKTVVKPIAVPVQVPVAVTQVYQQPMEPVTVGRVPTAVIPVYPQPISVGTPVGPNMAPVVCSFRKGQVILDQFGNPMDYTYVRICR